MENSVERNVLLVDPLRRVVLAWDENAELRYSRERLASDPHLSRLFPQIQSTEWDAYFDQNDKTRAAFIAVTTGADGAEREVRVSVDLLRGTDQQHSAILSIEPAKDSTGQLQFSDALTGLPDRRELSARFRRWQQSNTGTRPNFALLFLDIDEFKRVNDSHGHAAGDLALTTLTRRWQSCVREGDLVVRYGGDEFVVLLENVGSHEEAKPAIARLQQATAEAIPIGDKQLALRVTVGVALSASETDDLAALIAAADRDMYAAKEKK